MIKIDDINLSSLVDLDFINTVNNTWLKKILNFREDIGYDSDDDIECSFELVVNPLDADKENQLVGYIYLSVNGIDREITFDLDELVDVLHSLPLMREK